MPNLGCSQMGLCILGRDSEQTQSANFAGERILEYFRLSSLDDLWFVYSTRLEHHECRVRG